MDKRKRISNVVMLTEVTREGLLEMQRMTQARIAKIGPKRTSVELKQLTGASRWLAYQLERNERERIRKRPGRVPEKPFVPMAPKAVTAPPPPKKAKAEKVTKVIAASEEVVPPPAPVVPPPAVEVMVAPPPPDPPPVPPEEPIRMADREAKAASQTWEEMTDKLDVPVAEVAQTQPKAEAQPLRKTKLPMTTSGPLPPNTPPVNWPYFPRHGLKDAA